MIIGNGGIADSFRLSKLDHASLCIVAAGHADSTVNDPNSFGREVDMFKRVYEDNKSSKFIYFSTVSKYISKEVTAYIKHKLHMEDLIASCTSRYTIISLPNVICSLKKNNQLIPWLYHSLQSGKQIEINPEINRYVLPADTIPLCVKEIACKNYKQVALIPKTTIKMYELIEIIEKITAKKFNINYSNSTKHYQKTFEPKQYDFVYEVNNSRKNIERILTQLIRTYNHTI